MKITIDLLEKKCEYVSEILGVQIGLSFSSFGYSLIRSDPLGDKFLWNAWDGRLSLESVNAYLDGLSKAVELLGVKV